MLSAQGSGEGYMSQGLHGAGKGSLRVSPAMVIIALQSPRQVLGGDPALQVGRAELCCRRRGHGCQGSGRCHRCEPGAPQPLQALPETKPVVPTARVEPMLVARYLPHILAETFETEGGASRWVPGAGLGPLSWVSVMERSHWTLLPHFPPRNRSPHHSFWGAEGVGISVLI